MSTGIDVVGRAYEAFRNLDAEALIAVADPEIEFGTSAAAPGGTYRGHTGIRRYVKEIEGAFGHRWEAEIERVADVGRGPGHPDRADLRAGQGRRAARAPRGAHLGAA